MGVLHIETTGAVRGDLSTQRAARGSILAKEAQVRLSYMESYWLGGIQSCLLVLPAGWVIRLVLEGSNLASKRLPPESPALFAAVGRCPTLTRRVTSYRTTQQHGGNLRCIAQADETSPKRASQPGGDRFFQGFPRCRHTSSSSDDSDRQADWMHPYGPGPVLRSRVVAVSPPPPSMEESASSGR